MNSRGSKRFDFRIGSSAKKEKNDNDWLSVVPDDHKIALSDASSNSNGGDDCSVVKKDKSMMYDLISSSSY